MENFVGAIFLTLLIVGLAMAMVSNTRPKGSPASNRLQVGGLLTMGAGFLWFGLLCGYLVRTSPRPTVVGTIGALKQHGGKYAASDFTVVSDGGERVQIHCSYHGTGLQTGERIRVHYVQYDQNLLDAEILSGAMMGWHFAESDQSLAAIFLSLFGFFCLYAAYSTNRKFVLSNEENRRRSESQSLTEKLLTRDENRHSAPKLPRGQR